MMRRLSMTAPARSASPRSKRPSSSALPRIAPLQPASRAAAISSTCAHAAGRLQLQARRNEPSARAIEVEVGTARACRRGRCRCIARGAVPRPHSARADSSSVASRRLVQPARRQGPAPVSLASIQRHGDPFGAEVSSQARHQRPVRAPQASRSLPASAPACRIASTSASRANTTPGLDLAAAFLPRICAKQRAERVAALTCRVEIHQVQPARAGLRIALRDGQRLVGVALSCA